MGKKLQVRSLTLVFLPHVNVRQSDCDQPIRAARICSAAIQPTVPSGPHLCRRVRENWTPTAGPENNLKCHERDFVGFLSVCMCFLRLCQTPSWQEHRQGAPCLMQSLLIYVAYVLRLHRSSQTYGLLGGEALLRHAACWVELVLQISVVHPRTDEGRRRADIQSNTIANSLVFLTARCLR